MSLIGKNQLFILKTLKVELGAILKVRECYIIYLIIVLLPFSPMLKEIFSLNGPFVEPSYVLSFLYFIYLMLTNRKIVNDLVVKVISIFVFIYLFLSFFGAFFSSLNLEFTSFTIYDSLVQPLKLVFNLILFYVVYSSFLNGTISTGGLVKTLVFSLLFQVLFSIFMFVNWLGYFDLISKSFFLQNSFNDRFSLPVNGYILPRFFGTSAEPAPYGYFGLVCFCYAYFFCKEKQRFVLTLKVLSCLVVITSLSDQVFIALFPILFHYIFLKHKRGFYNLIFFMVVLSCSMFFIMHIFESIIYKLTVSSDSGSLGSSSGERFFHFTSILKHTVDSAIGLFFGNGSGLYGFYLNGIYTIWPVSTTSSILVGDILFSYGLIGLAIFILLAVTLFIHSPFLISAILIGNMFQYDWKLTSFFFILAIFSAKHFGNNKDRYINEKNCSRC
ncbi:hypothetical protein ACRN9N_18265 [Shewanella baltica]|uniref:hypothetical protein n=1 Tax=Shewanella TaxID=22 RepID=UPI003D7963B8